MLSAFLLALRQLADPPVLRLWLKSLSVTLLACAALGAAGWWGLDHLLDRAGTDRYGVPSELLAIVAVIFAGWLLWRVVALAVLQFFADEVVIAVERRHYPAAAANARKLGWREELGRGLAGGFRALLFNLAALPFAAVLLVTGVGAPLLFLTVNAVLLGRELTDMVWLRHRPAGQGAPPVSRLERWTLGGIVAALLAVPGVNFLAPFLGAAAAAHLIHRKGIAQS